MQQALSGYGKKTFLLACRDYKLKFSQRTRIMGILNVTPDSFSDGGNYFDADKAVVHALEMEKDGADIIDIGAESTRPGAAAVPAVEQLRRIEGIVRILARKLKVPISIDTSDSLVARRCLDAGASIINDVYALRKDDKLGAVVARYQAGLVLMHMQNNPRTMQKNPRYNDVIAQITDFLKKAKEMAIGCGIKEESIIVDPGIGFGKTIEHNLKIIKYLSRFKVLGVPLLIGTSRKSFIGNVLGVSMGEREFGTAASVALCALNGAHIVRVHDVRHMREVVAMTEAINNQKAYDD
ncbi:MAG: dihydropteroate synthase [Candidatus Omnitrophica bacterium]|nr:dihydropteroate synthase [Candidatus Omnitrophota bacterium]MBU4478327.1 dihydropteroate synthase [Candidatus Omnitrophota bacterium]